jgi:hypothetical protein
MDDVFERVLLPTTADDKGILLMRSLIANYSTMAVNECCASVEHYRLYGQGYHLHNLDWSQEMLERSCEDDLRNKILEKSMDIPAIQMGGPTFLTLIMHEVTSPTEDSIRALTSRITNMKLTNFKGEDVTKAASQPRDAIAALEIVNQVLHNIVERLIDIFQTTSVVEFNATFRVMRIQQRTLGMNFVRAEIMNLAESLYSDLSSKGEWNGVANSGDDSVFLGQRDTVCWDCGETGHRAGIHVVSGRRSTPNPTQTYQKRSKLRQGQASGWPPKKATRMKRSSVGAPTSGTPNVTAGGARRAIPVIRRTLLKCRRLPQSPTTPRLRRPPKLVEPPRRAPKPLSPPPFTPEQPLRQFAPGRPDADTPDWLAAYT